MQQQRPDIEAARDGTPDGPGASPQSTMMDVSDVAQFLRCSPRTVRRLADSGRMPEPIRLGRLVRWDRGALQDWIAAGCPS